MSTETVDIYIDGNFFWYSIGCEPGYFDVNCTQRCKYPTFGVQCQNICSCQEKLCNFSSGCKIINSFIGKATLFNLRYID